MDSLKPQQPSGEVFDSIMASALERWKKISAKLLMFSNEPTAVVSMAQELDVAGNFIWLAGISDEKLLQNRKICVQKNLGVSNRFTYDLMKLQKKGNVEVRVFHAKQRCQVNMLLPECELVGHECFLPPSFRHPGRLLYPSLPKKGGLRYPWMDLNRQTYQVHPRYILRSPKVQLKWSDLGDLRMINLMILREQKSPYPIRFDSFWCFLPEPMDPEIKIWTLFSLLNVQSPIKG